MHARLRPHPHRFVARMFMFLIDLDELEQICHRPLISYNRFNAYTFRDHDHLFMGHATLRENVLSYLQQQGISDNVGRIRLLTNLRVLGYVFNPVSFFWIDRTDGTPLCLLAEVHNTYGELKPYLLSHDDLDQEVFSATRPKAFYISPFSDVDQQLRLSVGFPERRLSVQVDAGHRVDEDPDFKSMLTGQQIPLTNGQLLRFSLKFPLVTLKVITLIHWHALRLWVKGNKARSKRATLSQQTGILPKSHQT